MQMMNLIIALSAKPMVEFFVRMSCKRVTHRSAMSSAYFTCESTNEEHEKNNKKPKTRKKHALKCLLEAGPKTL